MLAARNEIHYDTRLFGHNVYVEALFEKNWGLAVLKAALDFPAALLPTSSVFSSRVKLFSGKANVSVLRSSILNSFVDW